MIKTSVRIVAVIKVLTYCAGLLAYLMVSAAVGPAVSVIFLLSYLVSILSEWYGRFPVPRWSLNVVSLLIIGGTALRISYADPVTPLLQALLMMLGVKLVEQKRFRDFMQIYVLAIFLLAGAALISLDIMFLAALLVLVYILAAATILLTFYAQDHSMEVTWSIVRKMLLTSLVISSVAIPLSAVLFVILPRSSIPLLDFLNRGGGAVSGFSEQVAIGEVSAIQDNTDTAFRVVMPVDDEQALYWRGIVLDAFDGNRWFRSPAQGKDSVRTPQGRSIRYTLYLEPHRNRYLLTLDLPVSVTVRQVFLAGDRTAALPGIVERRLRYDGLSVLASAFPADPPLDDRLTRLPDADWSDVKAYARLVIENRAGIDAANALLLYLRESGAFKYSTTALPKTPTPLRTFLFESHTGNCEYFASAMAVMLRLEGIPARLVGGYHGGTYNTIGGYYAVTQENAHVWVEAYFRNVGWVRYDPTPATAQGGSDSATKKALLPYRMFVDTLQYYWTVMVITYDFEKQIRLLTSTRQKMRSFSLDFNSLREPLAVLVTCIGGAAFFVGFVAYLQRRSKPDVRLLGVFLAELARRGYVRTKAEGLLELVRRIPDGPLHQDAMGFVTLYQSYAFRDRKIDKQARALLKEYLHKIKGIQ